MTTKEIFLADASPESLPKYWATIAHDRRFEIVIIMARAVLMESAPNADQIKGAENFIAILSTLADGEGGDLPFPSPGLHHFPDIVKDPPPPKAS